MAALLDGLPQLVAPERKPKAPGKRLEKFGASYTFCITPKMRAMVVQMGGAGYLRSLIDKEVHAL